MDVTVDQTINKPSHDIGYLQDQRPSTLSKREHNGEPSRTRTFQTFFKLRPAKILENADKLIKQAQELYEVHKAIMEPIHHADLESRIE